MVSYYDLPEHCAWHLLSDKEAAVLYEEIRKCSEDFEYFARNYAWITEKTGADIPFSLWESQEMVYETIKRLKARGRGVKLLIVKGRQLGISTLIEAIIAWISMFSPNSRGLVVSYDPKHAAYLFGIILHIYDQLPWWLRPMIGSREYQDQIHLINPDPDLRRLNPGLNSRITVQGASQYAGIAEGHTINSAHVSEFSSYPPDRARKIISGDFRWALPDAPNTFAVLETRVRQASRFTERLWESMMQLGDMASWYPLFLPIYFDKSHFIAPAAGWKPDKTELSVKERAGEEWCTCSGCGQVRASAFGGESTVGTTCQDCRTGTYTPYVLQDGQMRWLWEQRLNAEALGEKAVMEMKQSLATNPQEAFQYVSETLFSRSSLDWVSKATRPELALGYMAADGTFHAPLKQHGGEDTPICRAQGCKENHAGEANRFLKIWYPPVKGRKYAMGVDVASGMGGLHDYSVIWVNQIGDSQEPDIQVAMYRCNSISAWHFADVVNSVGRWYNNALAIVDYTNYQTTGDRLMQYHQYPNLYRWKNPDSENFFTSRFHWVWNSKNKESSWTVLDGRLQDHCLVPKDSVFAREVRHYQRNPDGTIGAPNSKEDDGLDGDFEKVFDDTVSAAIQCVVGSHDLDYRRSGQAMADQPEGLRDSKAWKGTCARCTKSFDAATACERDRCPSCGSPMLGWKKTVADKLDLGFNWDELGGPSAAARDRFGTSQDFSFGERKGSSEYGQAS